MVKKFPLTFAKYKALKEQTQFGSTEVKRCLGDQIPYFNPPVARMVILLESYALSFDLKQFQRSAYGNRKLEPFQN